MENYFIGVIVLIFGAIFTLFIKNQSLKLKFTSLIALVAGCFCSINAINAINQTHFNTLLTNEVKASFNLGSIFQNVTFTLDGLSAFFVIVISVMSAVSIIYSIGYLDSYIKKGKEISAHCVFLLMLTASMLLVVTVQNALLFLIIWELMSLSSFFLVIFEHENKDVIKAGIKYLVYMHVSVIFIILLFVLLSTNAHSLSFEYFKDAIQNDGVFYNIIFIFAFIGFGIKAGFAPFHNWLPDAHPAAPSHVSAIMSGVMIKTGIYGILRILTFTDKPSCQLGYFVLIISAISALYGVLYAISQHDLKRLLAYHSIENIGIIGLGIGVGMLGLSYDNDIVAFLGFSGAILHVLNHSIFKQLLFLSAGSVYTKLHTRDIEVMGGLIKYMPKTALFFLIASIAICGLPPFNGFISEFLIYFGMLKGLLINNFASLIGFIFALASLALVGTMAILCFTKAFSIVFLGEPRSRYPEDLSENNKISFMLPMLLLAIFIVIIGLFPKQAIDFITGAVFIYVPNADISIVLYLAQVISYTCFALVFFILVLFSVKYFAKDKDEKYTTWGCGYNRINSHMQYSASSYASPFISTLTPLFKKVVDIKKPKTIFPKDAHYEVHLEDVEEEYFLKPILKSTEKFFEKFEQIQNGNIQQYITYGILFLVISLIGVVLLG